MKTRIIILCFFCFISFKSTALCRIGNAVRVLHSIFDRDTPDKAASPGNYIGSEDGWSRRFSAGPARMPDYIRNARRSRDEIRRAGTGLMIAGGCTAFGGGGLLLYGDRNGLLVPIVFGYLLLVAGAALALVGLPVWLTHLDHSAVARE